MRIVLLLAFAVLLTSVFAVKVIEVDLVVFKNDSAKLAGLRVIDGEPTDRGNVGDYVLRVEDINNKSIHEEKFNLNFFVGELKKSVDSKVVSRRILFSPAANRIVLLHNNKTVFEKEIFNVFCNSDKKCNNLENHFSCASDCKSGTKDNYCDGVIDGICDIDCSLIGDLDCHCGNKICEGDLKEDRKTCAKDCVVNVSVENVTNVTTTNVAEEEKKVPGCLGLALLLLIPLLYNNVKKLRIQE
ncbi:hypothetical protein HY570_00895 [Candidatus Micrarchaeota archaeon]|nr:hypothetical protein [Candidatus Micrarchaeota archaeon]